MEEVKRSTKEEDNIEKKTDKKHTEQYTVK